MNRPAAAFFDVDGTLLAGNIVLYYVALRTWRMRALKRALWTAGFALRVPWYMALDLASRARFQRALYLSYRELGPAELAVRAQEFATRHLVPALFPGALVRVREHQQRGEAVVLLTGSLRPIVAPLASHLGATDLVAPELEVRGGTHTGKLAGVPLAGAAKAEALADWAARHGFDLAACHAYADSLDDLAMLRRVGHAHVVNPGRKLEGIARREGWEVLRWGVG